MRASPRSFLLCALSLLATGLAALSPLSASAQMQLVKDIFASGNPNQSAPNTFVQFGGVFYFRATTAAAGQELWKTDGTEAGTQLVKDIASGNTSALPIGMTVFNGALYFSADDGINGRELWKTDGTEAGTVMVKDIMSGSTGSNPTSLLVFDGALYFSANGGTGSELWRSDGTAAGTNLFKEIRSGTNSSSPSPIVATAGFFFLTADDGPTGAELWKCDGTAAGTVRVKDIRPGNGNSSFVAEPVLIGTTLYFRANTDAAGSELWKSDGTEAGTVMVKDIRPGTGFGGVGGLVNFNGTLCFSATNGINGSELWKSDGTEAGTQMVLDIRPGGQFSDGAPKELTVIGSTLYFKATTDTAGTELWKTDGTAAGTAMVKDIRPGDGFSSSDPNSLVVLNSTLYFFANDGVNGNELWKSDGTGAGTVMVKDIFPGASGSRTPQAFNLTPLFLLGSELFFDANDGIHGPELWKSDGTTVGTVLVKDLSTGTGDSLPGRLRPYNGGLVFVANDFTNGPELWKSDGTEAGTQLLKDILPGSAGSEPEWLTNVNGTLFFSASTASGDNELWKTNGTSAGTVLVKDIVAGSNGSFPASLVNVNGTLFFSAYSDPAGIELWKSNGTAAGTVMVKDIYPEDDSDPTQLTNVNGTLFFVASNDDSSGELWKSNGTSAGTVMVKDINGDSFGSSVELLTEMGGKLYFTADDDNTGSELWVSNGTAAGTKLVKDIRTGGAGSFPNHLTNVNGTLYFTANDGVNGTELWKSDGTAAGTVMLKNIASGSASSSPYAPQSDLDDEPRRGFIVVGDLFYFVATTSATGAELWQSDGTEAGTVIVNDLTAGSGGSDPANLTAVNDKLYFDALIGGARQTWQTDGTPEGTVVVDAALSRPGPFAVSGSTFFASALRGDVGVELFKIPNVGPPPVVITDDPDSLTVNPNKPASFTVAATGKAPLTYQWRFNGANIDKATAATYKIASAKEANQGNYDVVVTSTEGSAISAVATLSVNDPIVITQQPAAVLAAVGAQASFDVEQTGSPVISWQWFKGTKAETGATTDTLTFDPVTLARAGAYSVKVTNPLGTVASASALLAVVDTADVTIGANPNASLVLNVPAAPTTGATGLTWQWTKGGTPLVNGGLGGRVSGATSPKLTITKFTAADQDTYSCIVKLGSQELESGQIQVLVRDKPQIEVVPAANLPDWFVSATVDAPITALITILNPEAQHYPNKFTITGLPAGLTYNSTTGQITGKPTKAGDFPVKIVAANPAGSSATVITAPIHVESLPASVVGSFNGLVARGAAFNNNHGGSFTVTTTSTGSITGKVVLLGKSYVLKNAALEASVIGGDPTGSVEVKPATGGSPAWLFTFTIHRSTGELTGNLTSQGLPDAAVGGWINPWRTTAPANPATSRAGYYTAAIQISPAVAPDPDPIGDLTYPQGDGYLTLTVTTAGVASWKGQLADGAGVTGSATMGPNGETPIHVMLYGSTGSVQGWAGVSPDVSSPPASYANNALDGAFTWLKNQQPAASKTRSYKAGFPSHHLTLIGSAWTKPISPNLVLGLSDASGGNNARITFTGGLISNSALGASGTLAQDLRVKAPGNTIVMPPAAQNPAAVKFTTFASATGLIAGSFTLKDPDPTKPSTTVPRATNFYGVLVNRLEAGAGHFNLARLPQAASGPTPTTSPQESGKMSFSKITLAP